MYSRDRQNFTRYLARKWNISHETAGIYTSELIDKFLPIKRYLRDYDGTICSPSPQLDQVWHELILNTRFYADICSEEGSFINHNAMAIFDPIEVKAARYGRTLEAYDFLFGRSSREGIHYISETETEISDIEVDFKGRSVFLNLWPNVYPEEEAMNNNDTSHSDKGTKAAVLFHSYDKLSSDEREAYVDSGAGSPILAEMSPKKSSYNNNNNNNINANANANYDTISIKVVGESAGSKHIFKVVGSTKIARIYSDVADHIGKLERSEHLALYKGTRYIRQTGTVTSERLKDNDVLKIRIISDQYARNKNRIGLIASKKGNFVISSDSTTNNIASASSNLNTSTTNNIASASSNLNTSNTKTFTSTSSDLNTSTTENFTSTNNLASTSSNLNTFTNNNLASGLNTSTTNNLTSASSNLNTFTNNNLASASSNLNTSAKQTSIAANHAVKANQVPIASTTATAKSVSYISHRKSSISYLPYNRLDQKSLNPKSTDKRNMIYQNSKGNKPNLDYFYDKTHKPAINSRNHPTRSYFAPEAAKGDTTKSRYPDNNEIINVKVVDMDRHEIHFKVTKGTILKKLMDAYSTKKGVRGDDITFLFDGTRLNPTETVGWAGILDGDIIDTKPKSYGNQKKPVPCIF